ncbi:penicillin-binding protein 1A [Ketogulonicigenium vulgare]|uniref:Penicillin-binding protein 1A n=1 Tax=Ketogulonicigenium vulgare (strain WSH-001) TaxID=759362 RepID=F9Y4A5_KETVW|nr:PBP1A family penicillin-binding protein [Ketogulonicigenium vulgare]AEM40541.1 Penicillin-binding protein 1A [Ketogulonicigenium vulgare WSH-001]ALJ80728.1 penicillin-binding protein [Ketogulonicigenium vulgare]ANW33530.1 penicillin-binding protein [Ketogulonicigenium vulgare]AOZ54260.1 Penicillin-binding protein 1A [Ketogulonicigenium vulgare]
MLRFIASFFGGIFSFVSMALIFGALSMGAVIFVYSRDLPSYETLTNYAPPTISRIYSGEGQIIDEFANERRLFVPADQIPDLVKNAFISAEDQNFYTHPGYDIRGLAAVAVEALRSGGRELRGASTITQQVMKVFLLDGSREAERKIKEIILASRVEQVMSKDQILELYLNEIFLGQNSYGVAAAAQTYFNKSLDALTVAEVAYLAALPQSPSRLHPVTNHDAAISRRGYVLRRMLADGHIDQAAFDAAMAEPLRTVQTGDIESFRTARPPRDYFTDEIRRQLSRSFGEDQFFNGGLSIRATVNPQLQDVAALALQRALETYDRGRGRWHGTGQVIDPALLGDEVLWRTALTATDVPRDIALDSPWLPAVVLAVEDSQLRLGIEGVALDDAETPVVPRADIEWMRGNFHDNFTAGDVVLVRRMTNDSSGAFVRWTLRQVPAVEGAFMAMDVNTGRVLAMQGGFSYQSSVFNRATQARRQPGSSFKPFVYAAALDSGYTPATIVVDAPVEIMTPQGPWRPQNASNRFYGPTPLRTGIEQSRNLMTIRLAQEVGMDVVAEYAERFGVYDTMNPVLAASLGSEESTLYRMVAAYAMFANGGERVEPTLVDRVQDRYGRTIYRHDQRECLDCTLPTLQAGVSPTIHSERERIMNEVTAYQLTSMMQGVVQRGTGSSINLPVPIAGKTGTTNDAKDVWFIGYSSNIVAGCYIGYDTPEPMGSVSGGGTCGPVFQRAMAAAIEEYGGGPFHIPADCRFMNIDRFSGARLGPDASGPNVQAECFRAGEEPVFGITFDGGFAMSADLPLVDEVVAASRNVTNSSGGAATVGDNASFGTVTSGGLY